MKKVLGPLDRFVFEFTSPATMSLFRIFLGSIITLNLLLMAGDFQIWFTEQGWVPTEMVRKWGSSRWYYNPFMNVLDPTLMKFIYALLLLVAILYTIGLFSRVMGVLLLLGVFALQARNPIILNGGDTLTRASLFWMAFAPVGAMYSVDRLRQLKKDPGAPVQQASPWPQRLMCYQWALMYFTTAWAKGFGNLWREGTAAWYPPNLSEFTRFWLPGFLEQQPFVGIWTYGTLIIEVALGTLVFYRPWRKWVLIGGILLHAGIEYRLNIPLFAALCISGYVNFYDGEEVQAWIDRIKAKRQGRVIHEPAG
ncbi:MAG: HTTM domain-containing protein [Armatimonadetes bacterium]|nr:HTTM domain-containing protein [Armatimonadota bacterium]